MSKNIYEVLGERFAKELTKKQELQVMATRSIIKKAGFTPESLESSNMLTQHKAVLIESAVLRELSDEEAEETQDSTVEEVEEAN